MYVVCYNVFLDILFLPPSSVCTQHGTADVCVMLLGSKLDLEHRREVTTEEGRKVQSQAHTHTHTRTPSSVLLYLLFSITICHIQFADHHDITHFYEVSAKTGENVTESFEAFFREVHRKVSTTHVLLLYLGNYQIYQCMKKHFHGANIGWLLKLLLCCKMPKSYMCIYT